MRATNAVDLSNFRLYRFQLRLMTNSIQIRFCSVGVQLLRLDSFSLPTLVLTYFGIWSHGFIRLNGSTTQLEYKYAEVHHTCNAYNYTLVYT